MKPIRCIVAFCNRTTRDVICARCWRLVPAPTKLAIEDQGRLWRSAHINRDELAPFLSFSYWETMRQAAVEVYWIQNERLEERYRATLRRSEPDVFMTARERRGTRARP